jgi:hypothetical protein
MKRCEINDFAAFLYPDIHFLSVLSSIPAEKEKVTVHRGGVFLLPNHYADFIRAHRFRVAVTGHPR